MGSTRTANRLYRLTRLHCDSTPLTGRLSSVALCARELKTHIASNNFWVILGQLEAAQVIKVCVLLAKENHNLLYLVNMSKTYTLISPSDAAFAPPPGIIPDFQDPFSVRPYWIVTAAVGLVTTGILLALRLYTKIAVVKRCRWEDYTCCLSFIFFAAFAAQAFEVIDAKGGAHQWNVTDREMEQQYLFYNTADMMYSPAIGFVKISIILLVLRVFCPTRRDPFYWVLQSLNALNTIFYTIYFIIPFVLCDPRKKIWQPQIPGKCLQVFDLYISSAVFNVCSDILMYSAPLWKIWHLQMSKGQKLGMMSVFATGGL